MGLLHECASIIISKGGCRYDIIKASRGLESNLALTIIIHTLSVIALLGGGEGGGEKKDVGAGLEVSSFC